MKIDWKKFKKHIIYIALIVISCILVYSHNLSLNSLPMMDPITGYYPRATMMKEAYTKYHDFWPIWDPYMMSGEPYYEKAYTVGMDTLYSIFVFISPTIPMALNFNALVTVMLAGIFMYFLVFYLTKDGMAGLISAFVFMFNGFIKRQMIGPGYTTLNAFFFMPLIFLFALKALKSKKWVFYSVITGILFALQIRGGPDLKVAIWTSVLFGVLLATYAIGKNFNKRAVKVILIGLIVSIILLGLGAQKILPSMAYMGGSSKSEIGWDRIKDEKTPLSRMFQVVVEPIYEGMPKIGRRGDGATHVGIIPFILACYAAAMFWKKRFVLSLILSFVLFLLVLNIFSPSYFPFYFLVWKFVPLFKSFRHLYRVVIGICFIVSILAGIGASALLKKVEKNKGKKRMLLTFAGIIILLLLNLVVFNISSRYEDTGNVEEAIARNYIMQNISSFPGTFRVHTYETRGIDWGTEFTQVPLGLQGIYGYETQWYPPYFNVYLGIANQAPAKFWGILNVKYMTSLTEVNISGLDFIGEYERCEDCFLKTNDIQKAWGKYLYENKKFLPRSYVVENSVLVVGEENSKVQTIYALMLDERFDPSNTVIIKGKDMVNEYNSEELKRYSAIFLTQGSIDQSSSFVLKEYVDNGGILLPNIVEGETGIGEKEIGEMWGEFEGELNAIDDDRYITHSFDFYELNLDKDYEGFVVLSEKFSVFPGWEAKVDRKDIEILNANNMISSVYIDQPVNSVIFKYRPKPYILGRNITIMTLIIILAYFGYLVIKKRKILDMLKEKSNDKKTV